VKKLIIAVLAGSVCVASAAAASPFEGTWATDAEQCRVGPTSDSRFVIKGNRWSGYETTCRITSVRTRGNEHVLSRTCTSEEEPFKDRVTLRMNGEDSLTSVGGELAGQRLIRCGAKPAAARPGASGRPDKLIHIWDEADGICRGSGGARAMKGCELREEVGPLIQAQGWCLGKLHEATVQYRWHRCTKDSNKM